MRFVVKIGTNLLTDEKNSLNTDFIRNIVGQIAYLQEKGHDPLIVTSGAVAAGRSSVKLKKEGRNTPYRQLLAAVGQSFLLQTYGESFKPYGIVIGQVLLTMADFERKKSFLSTRDTVELMLNHKIIPIINENDVTTFDELKFGDNDNLSARLGGAVNADTLILLTDVEGLFNLNPHFHPDAKFIARVSKITPEIKKMAEIGHSSKSRGGMVGKIQAAEYATQAGMNVWVVKGTTPNVLIDLVQNKKARGTLFERQFTPREARRKWLQTQQNFLNFLVLDQGACQAILERGKSLLPSGIKQVKGVFKRGEVVVILRENGEKIGFGQVNYSSKEINLVKGHQSTEMEKILGYCLDPEIVHRDNMVNQIAKS